jgi:phospholipid transport system substrate-binding protein
MKKNNLITRRVLARTLLGFLLSVGVVALSNSASADAPRADSSNAASALPQVKSTLDQVVEISTKYGGEAKTDTRRQELRKAVDQTFDFREMAKRSLGAQWEKIDATEQGQFVDVFSDLLARTYMKRVEIVRDDMVSIQGEKLDFPRSIVRTIVNNKGDRFPIDYKLTFDGSRWRVYDVVIENIGLVANYRNEFAGIIRKEQFGGLMNRLKEKNAQG